MNYDIIVIGAGPAGAMAAKSAAQDGRSVCLLERKAKVGSPARCGEGIGLKGFSRHVELRQKWIKATITELRMVSPSGLTVDFKNFERNFDRSYVVDRELMDADLAEDAAIAGAEFICKAPVIAINRQSDGAYECITSDKKYSAPCVILADGVESRLARQVGWNNTLALSNIETCAFARIKHEKINQKRLTLHFGEKVAPGGYAWIFPRGDSCANVGLGILGVNSAPGRAKKLLDLFIADNFNDATVDYRHCGGVPVGKWLKPLVKGGAMVVGDAAGQVNALTGGGIAYALDAGVVAGKVAAEAFSSGKFKPEHLENYEKIWASDHGKQQHRSFALKRMVVNYTDKIFDETARTLLKEDPEHLNTTRFAIRAFAKHPILMLKALWLFR